jgi:nuclear pore complex protein Nup98-Nup96
MAFSGFSFPGPGQTPQQNTGTQGTSGLTFGSFATGLGSGGNTTPTGGGLFGGGTGTTTGTSNAPPSIFGGGTTGTGGGFASGGGPLGAGGLFGNLGSTGTTLGGTNANANTSTTAPTTTTSGSGLFGAIPNRTRFFLYPCTICSPIVI